MGGKNALDRLVEIGRWLNRRQYMSDGLLRRIGYIRKPTQAAATLRITLDVPNQRQATVPDESEGQTMVRDLLFDISPYDGFDPQPHPADLQGWGSDHPALIEAITMLRPARVCEVGSWKGRSAINMAKAAKALHLKTEIVCVDTWLGSPEHWLKQEHEWYTSLRIRNGMPQLYNTFMANVVRAGLSDVITPFPATSENAAAVFAALEIRFDLIYIDAAHEYEPAKRDIASYYHLLADNGLLIGDDYRIWPGVTRAADEFATERQLRIIGTRGKFVIPKGEIYADIAFAEGTAPLL